MKQIILIAALCSIAANASAETKHVKFTTPVTIDGQPLVNEIKCPTTGPNGHRDCETPWTVGELAYAIMEKPVERGQPPLSWADAIKRDDLAHAIRNADDFPLLDDQRTSIQAAMAAAGLSPAILGFVARVIDPPAPPTTPPSPK